ncbi:MAG: hypothetical protein E7089_09325 [Bacteroidales bacterium]|nr:hypothetical protein [Bacteroidales bacterium]
MKHLLYILISLPILLFTSCDVHEWPDAPATEKLHLKLNYETHITNWVHLYDGDKVIEQGLGSSYDNSIDYGTMRYIIRAYPMKNARYTSQYYTHEFVLTKSISEGYNHEVTLDLTPGNYTLMVWSDIMRGSNEYYYNPANFSEITLQGEYVGNSDCRDAFRGTNSIEIVSDIIDEAPDTISVTMQRPLAKYSIISTDLKEFIDKELEYWTRIATTRGELSPTRINTDEYNVFVYFSGYMPSAYNMNSDKPVDAKMGVTYSSKLDVQNEHEAQLGYDYVFVNGSNSAVTVQIKLCDKDDRQLALTAPIDIPLKRNHHTILKGSFLMEQASGGIKIDPSFDGNHNIVIE